MRIGLFTDTYRPSINGIVYVVESLKKHLEEQGHEVFIFCPARSMRASQYAEEFHEDEHVIRFPSVKGAMYDDYDLSLFFPPMVLAKIKDMNLDVIHFFTPGQIGMLGVHAAHKVGIPIVAQHCTDLRQYVDHYKDALLLPGLLALIALIPFAVKVSGKDVWELFRLYIPRKGGAQWNGDIVEHALTLVYSKCDAVIALSRKSKKQLESWQDDDYHYKVTLMPNGVNRLKPPTKKQLEVFQKQWGLTKKDEVFGFVGRIGAEKNLPILIKALEKIVKERPNAKLMYVGDFEFRPKLEEMARASRVSDRIIFTGAIDRSKLGVAYAAMDVFTFPSLTDTQGWVVHEAALAGLPLVLLDDAVSEIVKPGVNGYYAKNNAKSIAEHVVDLFSHPKKREEFGKAGQKLARKYTEKRQVAKLAKLYADIIKQNTVKE